jgi:membrane associated rhomboid family serine protease
MIPLRDDVRIRDTPIAVALLIATNVAAFLFVVSLDAADAASLFDRWALVPREFLRGAVQPAATRQMTWLTPVSSMFLHASLLHLAGNMLTLWIFSGLLGAYAISYPGARLRLAVPPLRVPALLFLTLWIAIQVASALQTRGDTAVGIAWWAHVGGFLAGITLVRSMWVRKPTRSRLRI